MCLSFILVYIASEQKLAIMLSRNSMWTMKEFHFPYNYYIAYLIYNRLLTDSTLPSILLIYITTGKCNNY